MLKISSKFELRRFCRTVGAVAMVILQESPVSEPFFFGQNQNLVDCFVMDFFILQQLKLCQPNPDDLGYVDSISVEEIAGVRVCKKMFL